MRTKTLKKAVMSVIKPVCKNAFFNRSPAVYPRIRLELKRVKTPPPVAQYILYLDFVGHIEDNDELEDIADEVYEAFSGILYQDSGVTVTAYAEQGELSEVPDTAADIKQLTGFIPLRAYFGKE